MCVEITDEETGNKQKKSLEKKQFLTWQNCKYILKETLYNTRMKQKGKKQDSISIIENTIDHICNMKINWRTKYK